MSNKRPPYPKLPAARANDRNGISIRGQGSPEGPSRRRPSAGPSRHDQVMIPKKRSVNDIHGSSPPDRKRSRPPDTSRAVTEYASPRSPMGGMSPPSRHNSIPGTLNPPTGPAPKTYDGRRIDIYRPDNNRRESIDRRQLHGAGRSTSDVMVPSRNGSIDGKSPLNTVMSPMSMHGEAGHSGSGRSTPIQVAPPAPSMTPITSGTSTAVGATGSKELAGAGLQQLLTVASAAIACQAHKNAADDANRIEQQGDHSNLENFTSLKAFKESRVLAAKRKSEVEQKKAQTAMSNAQAIKPSSNLDRTGAVDAGPAEVNERAQRQETAEIKALRLEMKRLKEENNVINEGMKHFKEGNNTIDERMKQTIDDRINQTVKELRQSLNDQVKKAVQQQLAKASHDAVKEILQTQMKDEQQKVQEQIKTTINEEIKETSEKISAMNSAPDLLKISSMAKDVEQLNSLLKPIQDDVSNLIDFKKRRDNNDLRDLSKRVEDIENRDLYNKHEHLSRRVQHLENACEDHEERIKKTADMESQDYQKICDLSKDVKRLTKDIESQNGLHAESDKQASAIDDLKRRLSTQQASIVGISDILDNQSTVVDQFPTLKSEHDILKNSVAKAELTFAKAVKKHDEQLEKANSRFDSLPKAEDITEMIGNEVTQRTGLNSKGEIHSIYQRLVTLEAAGTKGLAVKNFEKDKEELFKELKWISERQDRIESSTKEKMQQAVAAAGGEATAQVNDVKSKLSSMIERFEEVTRKELIDKIDHLEGRCQKIEGLENRCQKMDSLQHKTGQTLGGLQKRIATLEGRYNSIDSARTSSSTAVSHVVNGAGQETLFREEIDQIKADFQTLNADLEKAENEINSLSTTMKTGLTSVVTEFLAKKLEGFNTVNNQRLEAVNKKQEAHDGDISELKQKLSTLAQHGYQQPQSPNMSTGGLSPHLPNGQLPNGTACSVLPSQNRSRVNSPQAFYPATDQQLKILAKETDDLRKALGNNTTALDQQIKHLYNQYNKIAVAMQSFENRYENISTDQLHQNIVNTIQRMYPDSAGFVQQLNGLRNDLDVLKTRAVQPIQTKLHSFEQSWDAVLKGMAQARRAEAKVDDQITKVEELTNTCVELRRSCGPGTNTEAITKAMAVQLTVDTLEAKVKEVQRKQEDLQTTQKSLQTGIDNERKQRISVDDSIVKSVNAVQNGLQTSIDSERKERISADESIKTSTIGVHQNFDKKNAELMGKISDFKREIDQFLGLKEGDMSVADTFSNIKNLLAKHQAILVSVNGCLEHPLENLDFEVGNGADEGVDEGADIDMSE